MVFWWPGDVPRRSTWEGETSVTPGGKEIRGRAKEPTCNSRGPQKRRGMSVARVPASQGQLSRLEEPPGSNLNRATQPEVPGKKGVRARHHQAILVTHIRFAHPS